MKTPLSRFGAPLARGLRCLVLLGVLACPAWAKVHLRITATAAAIDAFNNWTGATSWEEIKSYKNPNAIRPAVDLILQLQALKAGGLDFDFELVRVLTYEQGKMEVVQGRADLTAETIWDSEIDEHAAKLLRSEPIIRDGEFVKGVYVLPGSEAAAIATLEDLRARVGVVVSSWALDVKTMEEIRLKGLAKTATPEIAFAQIQKGQADFTLAEFSSRPDLATETGGVKLVPVPNCKVAIMGSRSWIVAKSSPAAEAVHAALVTGTKKLREAGTIERAFAESGFFNARVADWKRIF